MQTEHKNMTDTSKEKVHFGIQHDTDRSQIDPKFQGISKALNLAEINVLAMYFNKTFQF